MAHQPTPEEAMNDQLISHLRELIETLESLPAKASYAAASVNGTTVHLDDEGFRLLFAGETVRRTSQFSCESERDGVEYRASVFSLPPLPEVDEMVLIPQPPEPQPEDEPEDVDTVLAEQTA
jgi:hypothetical protein